MILNNKESGVIDSALNQYVETGVITEKCPRCGGKILYEPLGNSYEVKCETEDCISEIFRGV